MPTGPKGQKRADVIVNAVRVMRIATGEEADDVVNDGKDPAAKRFPKAAADQARPKEWRAYRPRQPLCWRYSSVLLLHMIGDRCTRTLWFAHLLQNSFRSSKFLPVSMIFVLVGEPAEQSRSSWRYRKTADNSQKAGLVVRIIEVPLIEPADQV